MRTLLRSTLLALCVVAGTTSAARAQVLYQLPTELGVTNETFNNSTGIETEDCWVANSFQVSGGGTRLQAVTFRVGSITPLAPTITTPITVTIYRGFSLTNPNAGGGLQLLQSTTTTLSAPVNTFTTIALVSALDLNVGDIFYASLLIRGNPGLTFPYSSQAATPQGRSFFDVGPTLGAPYDLNNTSGAIVLGGNHPVVPGAQSPGNLILRVNAVPEPGSMALVGLGVASFVGFARRRRAAKLAV